MTKVGRNEPCPCGSGKKYKHCCLHKNADLPDTLPEDMDETAQEASALEDRPEFDSISINSLVLMAVVLAATGIVLGLAISSTVGWTIFGLGLIIIILWFALRKPPPPKDDSDNPAAINFGQ